MSRDDINQTWSFIVQEYASKANEGGGEDKIDIKSMLKTPKQIVEELDKTVIGQDKAKQLMAVAVWNRLLAMNNKMIGRDEEAYYFEKNNILLVGGTGCGKTHIIRALSKAVGLPVTIQDATTFTSMGYVGRNVDNAIDDLYDNAYNMIKKNHDTSNMASSEVKRMARELTEFGIVYIDEADKLRASGGPGKDVNGRSVQEAFLKIVEGSDVDIYSRNYYGKINTSNILFVFGGAFADMQKIINQRINTGSIGFKGKLKQNNDKNNLFQQVNIGDFTKFGMIPELMGRLSTVAILNDLDRDMIAKIFVEPNRSIMSQVINEFKSYGVHVSFSDDAIDYIVDKTMELKLGARGLKATSQQVLRPLFYYLPSNALNVDLIITRQMLEDINEDELS